MSIQTLCSQLPTPPRMQKWFKAMAMLDILLDSGWPCYFYYPHWRDGVAAAVMSDGSGDEYAVFFSKDGAWFKGFAHESAMTPYVDEPPQLWPGLFDDMPTCFEPHLEDNHYLMINTTFCAWHQTSISGWQCSEIDFPASQDPDGAISLLSPLLQQADGIDHYLEIYHETQISKKSRDKLHDNRPLNPNILKDIGSTLTWNMAEKKAKEIGYPVQSLSSLSS